MLIKGMVMDSCQISLMELSDIQEAVKVLSIAMLGNPLHIAVFKGDGEDQRLEIEKMFVDLFHNLPGIVFLAKERNTIVGVMSMKPCQGRKIEDGFKEQADENEIFHVKNRYMIRPSQD